LRVNNIPYRKKKFFTDTILEWGQFNIRNFIWREKRDDFFVVFVAEFFLRKTKAETVDKFLKTVFLKKYKTFLEVSQESEDHLKEILKPLGLYNQRAKALKKISLFLCDGKIPSFQEILNFPSCGRYIANAIECFYRNSKCPLVDHNIQRVFNRFFSVPISKEIHKAEYLWSLAEELLPIRDWAQYNYALLDFSALICKPNKAICKLCPLAIECDTYSVKKKNKTGE